MTFLVDEEICKNIFKQLLTILFKYGSGTDDFAFCFQMYVKSKGSVQNSFYASVILVSISVDSVYLWMEMINWVLFEKLCIECTKYLYIVSQLKYLCPISNSESLISVQLSHSSTQQFESLPYCCCSTKHENMTMFWTSNWPLI